MLQLGDDGRFQVTHDCGIIDIYRLEPFDSYIIFINNFICIMASFLLSEIFIACHQNKITTVFT